MFSLQKKYNFTRSNFVELKFFNEFKFVFLNNYRKWRSFKNKLSNTLLFDDKLEINAIAKIESRVKRNKVTFKERYSNPSKQKGDSDILRNDEMPKRFN